MNKRERDKLKASLGFTEGGKLPPQALEFEEAVLGSMMLEPSAVSDALSILTEDSFYKDAHARIFKSIKMLSQSSNPVDITTVVGQLRTNGDLEDVGGAYYISKLSNLGTSASKVEYHARIIQQKYMLREIIRISNEAVRDAYDNTSDVFEVHDKVISDLGVLTEFKTNGSVFGFSDMEDKFIERNNIILEARGLSGITTGFIRLNDITGGWQNTDFIVIAARPGMGKTALMLKMVVEACRSGKTVMVFSLEMSREQLFYRICAMLTNIESEKYFRKGLQAPEIQIFRKFMQEANKWKIIIDDTPALSIQDAKLIAKQNKRKYGIDLIMADYLQLFTAESSNRENEISKISGGFKAIAKEINIPVISLAQLSRSVETRGGDKRPMLSDLRESGAIEQDADMVQFLYRPEYYNITEDEKGNSLLGLGEIIIAKHRNGALDSVTVRFDPKTISFSDYY